MESDAEKRKTGSLTFEADLAVNSEVLISLPEPKYFTRAAKNGTECRPAALLPYCHFLHKLTSTVKDDLHKLANTHAHDKAKPHGHRRSSTQTAPPRDNWDRRMERLKIYQRAFSSIVIHFKAYCPVLFFIKKTYEDMLNYRIRQIKNAHFERKRIHIQKRNMKQQIESYEFPEHRQLRHVERYLDVLRQKIALQDEAITVITDILKNMEEALTEHFERSRDLEEQIIMADNEITNRRQKALSQREKEEKELKAKKEASRKENAVAAASEIDSDEEDKEDMFYDIEADQIDEDRRMIWIMSFAICHKDLEDAENKIKFYQEKYEHVIPRHENEEMKKKIIEEKSTTKWLVDEKAMLEDELSHLKELEVKLDEELSAVKTNLAELRTTVTPRPSWEQLGEFVQGGVPKWERLIQGKSTKDTTEKLFTELRSGSRRGGEKFLQPLGFENNILKCLRHGKKVPDRNLHTRDSALMICDIMTVRQQVLKENMSGNKQEEFDYGREANPATKSFSDYVAMYFEERYEDDNMRKEWTYNIVESCKRFSLDYRLTLFLDILQGWVDEGVYFVVQNELFRIRNMLLQKTVDEGTKGILASNHFVDSLEHVFPNKPEADIQSIVRVTNKLNQDLNKPKDPEEEVDLSRYQITQLIDYKEDGFRGPLVSECVKQFQKERQLFMDKIIGILASVVGVTLEQALNENDPAGNKELTVSDAYAAIKRADPDMDDEMVGAALAWVFVHVSVRPGGGISASRLVNYAMIHATQSEDDNPMGQMDDDQFERAVKDIIREDDDEGAPQMSEAQKKALYRALKQSSLRNIVKRIRGTALVPSWLAYNPDYSRLPQAEINVDVDLDVLTPMVAVSEPVKHGPALLEDGDDRDDDEEEGGNEQEPSYTPSVTIVEPPEKTA